MAELNYDFHGTARIVIMFSNKIIWEKYRKYILHTGWDFDNEWHPESAFLDMKFKNRDDIIVISSKIVQLLQLGFDVYGCRWTLAEECRPEEEPNNTLNDYVKIECEEMYSEDNEIEAQYKHLHK